MVLIAQDRAVAETDRKRDQQSLTCLVWNDIRDSAKKKTR